jgi:hypothetical protein
MSLLVVPLKHAIGTSTSFGVSTSKRGAIAGPLATLPFPTSFPHGPLDTRIGSGSRVIFSAIKTSRPK